MSTVIGTEPAARARRPERRPTGRTRAHVPPRALHRRLPHQPVDGPAEPTDTTLAVAQWQALYDTYLDLGYDVQLIDPIEGLPDMVYAANGGFVHRRHRLRRQLHLPRAPARGPRLHGLVPRRRLRRARARGGQRGRGRLPARRRHDPRRHRVPQRLPTPRGARARIFGREVVTLRLVNPSFYHLDTAVAVLDRRPARSTSPTCRAPSTRQSLAVLRERFPDAIIVNETDAAVLGLNSFSDGYNVVIASRADRLRAPAARARLQPDRRRPVRAAARRRRRQVLHPGAAAMTPRPTATTTVATRGHRRSRTSTPPTTTTRCRSSSRRATAPG